MRDISVLGALADPTRRAIYEMVSGAGDWVGRDEVADEMGVARQTAAYHLDRLAEEGLLEVAFARLSGRSGPGAGRPAKTYRRSHREYQLSVPPRGYLTAARILLAAARANEQAEQEAESAAREVGAGLGAGGLDQALIEAGYEPAQEGSEIRFRNCPFHVLVEEDRPTTCRLNLALVEGMAKGAADPRRPRLAPEEGYCCVRIPVEEDPAD